MELAGIHKDYCCQNQRKDNVDINVLGIYGFLLIQRLSVLLAYDSVYGSVYGSVYDSVYDSAYDSVYGATHQHLEEQ